MFARFWRWVRSEATSEAFRWALGGAWPFLYSAAVGVAGYVEHFPLATLLLIVAATFGFVSWGGYFFQQMIYQKSTAGKLRYSSIGLTCITDGNDQERHIRYVKVRLNLDSTAVFPMEFNVEKMTTILASRVNITKYPEANTLISVEAMGTAWYADSAIDLENVDRNAVISGTFEYTLKYGRPGRLRSKLSGKHRVAFSFKSPTEIGAFEAVELR